MENRNLYYHKCTDNRVVIGLFLVQLPADQEVSLNLYQLITKEIKYEDESRRVIVSLRVLYLIVFFAFLLDNVWAGKDLLFTYPVRIIIFFLALIALFIYTYSSRTKPALILFVVYMFLWTIFMIPCIGWSAGMQNYIIMILMLSFFATHTKLSFKISLAAFVLLVRIVMIWVYGGAKSAIEISPATDKLLQVTNISAVYLGIIFLSYFYSKKDNQEEGKLIQYNVRLKNEASTDQLTGLWNRRRAYEFLKGLYEDPEVHFITIAMGDIDFFKKVNDTYGHDAGDMVLKNVADTMKSACRSDTFLARWGGEEFLLIFPNCNGDDAFVALQRIRLAIEKSTTEVNETAINVTMTFGLTEADMREKIDVSIKAADSMLYIGKQNGRNQVVY